MPDQPAGDDVAEADAFLLKLSRFAADLAPGERRLLAALVAPGLDAAWVEAPEVEGYGVAWDPRRLPEHLARSIRARGLRVDGL